jgi:hypothetical protein
VAVTMSNGLVCCWHRWVLTSPLPKRDSPDRDMLLAVLSFSPIFVAMVDLAIFSRTAVKVMLLKEVLKVLDISQY